MKYNGEIYFKFLCVNNESPCQEFEYPKEIVAGYKTKAIRGRLQLCRRGYHAAFSNAYSIGGWHSVRCYIVIPKGEFIADRKDKICCRQLIFIGEDKKWNRNEYYLTPYNPKFRKNMIARAKRMIKNYKGKV